MHLDDVVGLACISNANQNLKSVLAFCDKMANFDSLSLSTLLVALLHLEPLDNSDPLVFSRKLKVDWIHDLALA